MGDLKKLTTFYKNLYKIKNTYSLTISEQFEINQKRKIITDSIFYYNKKFYKIEEIRANKKRFGEYPLVSIKIKEINLFDYKNSEKWYIKDFYNNKILPQLKKFNLTEVKEC